MGYFSCSATSRTNCIAMMFVPRGQCPHCFACVLGYHPPPGSLKLSHSKWWDDVSSCGVSAYSVLDSLSGESKLCLHATTLGMEKVFPLSMMACCQACFASSSYCMWSTPRTPSGKAVVTSFRACQSIISHHSPFGFFTSHTTLP